MNKDACVLPWSPSANRVGTENTRFVSNADRSISDFHTQSLSALQDLKLRMPTPNSTAPHSCRNNPPCLAYRQRTAKDMVVKQVTAENLRKQTEAFTYKTHSKPPLHPSILSHAYPTVPNEFNLATRHRAMSRDRLKRHPSTAGIRSRSATPTAGIRSRSTTASSRDTSKHTSHRAASPPVRPNDACQHRGRLLLRKPATMDNMPSTFSKQPLTEPKQPLLSCATLQCKQEQDFHIKKEDIFASSDEKISLKSTTSCRTLTTPMNITLNTESRVAVWQHRRQLKEENEKRKNIAQQKKEEEREAMLKQEAQAAPIIKATPMPFYPAPPMPARSTKPLTQPIAPRFVHRPHKRNNSSSNSTGVL